jgi:prevent-host-death family protein
MEVISLKATILPDVRPVSDLRQNMAEVMESIDAEKRPVILTKHGRGRYILLSIEDYNRITAFETLHNAIDEGIADIEAGRVSDFREFAQKLREDMKNGHL